ncbi:hypothetical protein L873DRAFT_809583 [Choiromyces venosus 120613-1]|uniref:Uncharacterized protein n=1 Tax=Choiromyces venosus 120613-1 TaxID=1336337 RepID=A0A3N4JQ21_9PEZI|nr:hypothetical protein L873DRAFT_809583 [Choiromyces venosus 120613-1]
MLKIRVTTSHTMLGFLWMPLPTPRSLFKFFRYSLILYHEFRRCAQVSISLPVRDLGHITFFWAVTSESSAHLFGWSVGCYAGIFIFSFVLSNSHIVCVFLIRGMYAFLSFRPVCVRCAVSRYWGSGRRLPCSDWGTPAVRGGGSCCG